jgi:hypothetical protein
MTERRKGGRRKGRAVKYSPGDDLVIQFRKAFRGAYFDEQAWYVIPFILYPELKDPSDPSWQKCRKIIKKNLPGANISEDLTRVLFDEIKKAIKNRNWSYFGKLQKMFELAEKTKGKSVDPIRESLVSVNHVLHAYSYVLEAPDPKPRDILKAWRVSCPELVEMEEADCYKIMRELGVPRRPEKKDPLWEHIVQLISDQQKNWKNKN